MSIAMINCFYWFSDFGASQLKEGTAPANHSPNTITGSSQKFSQDLQNSAEK
jgi:hypothetical protein